MQISQLIITALMKHLANQSIFALNCQDYLCVNLEKQSSAFVLIIGLNKKQKESALHEVVTQRN